MDIVISAPTKKLFELQESYSYRKQVFYGVVLKTQTPTTPINRRGYWLTKKQTGNHFRFMG